MIPKMLFLFGLIGLLHGGLLVMILFLVQSLTLAGIPCLFAVSLAVDLLVGAWVQHMAQHCIAPEVQTALGKSIWLWIRPSAIVGASMSSNPVHWETGQESGPDAPLTSPGGGTLGRPSNASNAVSRSRLANFRRGTAVTMPTSFRMLSRLSHELNTCLNAILGAAQALKATKAFDGELVDIILHTSKIIANLVGDFVDLSECQQNQLALSLHPFLLSNVLESLFKSFDVEAHRLGIHFQASSSLPVSLRVMGDSVRLRQVLSHLLCNSFQAVRQVAEFNAAAATPARTSEAGGTASSVSMTLNTNSAITSPTGTVHLAVVRQPNVSLTINEGPAPGTVEIQVTDNGIGILDQDKPKLFTPFAQFTASSVEGNNIRTAPGFGLGLCICKQLVQLMGGNLEINSSHGSGTTVSFTIPANVDLHKLDDLESSTTPRPHCALDLPSRMSRMPYPTTPSAGVRATPRSLSNRPKRKMTVVFDTGGPLATLPEETTSRVDVKYTFSMRSNVSVASASASASATGSMASGAGGGGLGSGGGNECSFMSVVPAHPQSSSIRSSAQPSMTSSVTTTAMPSPVGASFGARSIAFASVTANMVPTPSSMVTPSNNNLDGLGTTTSGPPTNPLDVSHNSPVASANPTTNSISTGTRGGSISEDRTASSFHSHLHSLSSGTGPSLGSPKTRGPLSAVALSRITSTWFPDADNLDSVRRCFDAIPQSQSCVSMRNSANRLPTLVPILTTQTQTITSTSLCMYLVDDNMINLIILKRLLSMSLACVTRTFESASVACRALLEDEFNIDETRTVVLLTDIHMPGMDGLELCRTLRKTFGPEKLPIIGVTADRTAELRETCMEGGMQAVLTKPVMRGHLIETLSHVLLPHWGDVLPKYVLQ